MKKLYSLLLGSLIIEMCAGTALAEQNVQNRSIFNSEKVYLLELKKQSVQKLSAKTRISDPDKTEPITQPQGETFTYLESGKAWTTLYGFYRVQVDFTVLSDICFDGDDVYIKNPISQFATETYLKGSLEGEKIVCKLPQLFYKEADSDGVVYDFYVSRLNGEIVEGDYGPVWSYSVAETDNQVTYSLINGKWVMDLDDYDTIIGLIDDEEYWYGYGDCGVVYEEFNATPIEVPAGLTTEEWAFSADGSGHFVNVGFDGEEVYVQGISTYIPEAWVKGKVEGDKIVFEGNQYMGSYQAATGFYLAYFIGGIEYDNGGSVNYYIQPEIAFSYDATSKQMNYEYTVFVNSATEYIRYLEMFNYPVIRWQPASFNPTPDHVTLDTFSDSYGYYGIRFNLPNVTPEGYLLDTDNIYWRLLLDGEVFEFDEETYGEIEGDGTEIPYGFYSDTFEIMSNGGLTTVFLYVEGFDVLSIQALYKDPTTGQNYYAETLNYNVVTNQITFGGYGETTKVEKISDLNKTDVEYYDLNGVKVNSPEKGIYVQRATYSDGSVRTLKVVRR